MKRNWPRLILFLIIVLAFLIRVPGLASFPTGFTADEAAQGYTAYSILKTGSDEWGKFLPLNPRSFGDFKAPLYTYLAIPSIALFGLNEFAVRFPSVVLGALAVLFTYLLANELFKNKKLALIAALFLAISPWHFSLSRGAFEANLTTFFLPAGLYFFLKGIKKPGFLTLSFLFFGLNLFTYHSARLVTLIFLGFLFLWKRKELWPISKKYLVSYSVLVFFLIGFLLSFLGGAISRVGDIGIFSAGLKIPDIFLKNYFSYFSLNFLFFQGAKEATYGMIPGKGLLYLFELPLLISAIFFLIKKWQKNLLPLVFWIILAPLAASLAFGVGFHANRVAVMMPAIQIFSAYGLILLWQRIKGKRLKIFAPLLMSLVVLFSLINFLRVYITQSPEVTPQAMGYGWQDLVELLEEREDKFEKIIISRKFSEPQAYLAFYKKWDPESFQKESLDWLRYEKDGLMFVDQLGHYKLGKYEFRDIHWPVDKELTKTLLVVKDGEANLAEAKSYRIIPYPTGKPAFLVIEQP